MSALPPCVKCGTADGEVCAQGFAIDRCICPEANHPKTVPFPDCKTCGAKFNPFAPFTHETWHSEDRRISYGVTRWQCACGSHWGKDSACIGDEPEEDQDA